MATAIPPGQFVFMLTASNGQPPSALYPVLHEEPTPVGCPICQATIELEAQWARILITLAADAPPPVQLRAMVLATTGGTRQAYAPDAAALQALASFGKVAWCLPLGTPVPTSLVLSFGFLWQGQMWSHDVTVR